MKMQSTGPKIFSSIYIPPYFKKNPFLKITVFSFSILLLVSITARTVANNKRLKKLAKSHWAFQPMGKDTLPTVKNQLWVKNRIDSFILSQLEEKKLTPSPEAPRRVLIKRLYYDLLGLTPEPNRVHQFENSTSPTAYEELVEELLASPRFGERWGRHWLDKARYADSDGYEKDRPRPNAWRYRDWVIEAINSDLPYDLFSSYQLAGDLLPNPTPSQRLATAFNRQTLTNTEGGTDQEEFRVAAVFDRVETFGAVWLGLTLGCARCHDHKYDAISQKEYFSLFSLFNNADESNTNVSTSDLAQKEYERNLKNFLEGENELVEKLRVRQKVIEGELDQHLKTLSKKIETGEIAPLEILPTLPTKHSTSDSSQLVAQGDGSFLATGSAQDKGTYVLEYPFPKTPLSGLRLDVLADPQLPKKGPGRAENGNFVLSEIRLELITEGKAQKVPFQSAKASFSQNEFAVSKAIDGKEDYGWAIAPKMGSNQWAEFTLKSPLLPSDHQGAILRIHLVQNYRTPHRLGRFRIRLKTGSDPDLKKETVSILRKNARELSPQERQQIVSYLASKDPEHQAHRKKLADFQKAIPKAPSMRVRVLSERRSNRRKTRILERGDFLRPGEEVHSGALAVLPPLQKREQSPWLSRLELSNWLFKKENALASRVSVNHVWKHLFGVGLVDTMEDFGIRGTSPSHSELLDWLGNEYRELQWSRKALVRLIVNSATYRQDSKHRPEYQNQDPKNRYLHRQNRFRTEAETIRDLTLDVSGLLSTKIGGPSVFPPLPPGIAELSYANNFKWNTSKGEDRYRRGLYTFFKRTSPHPTLITFDCPDSNTSSLRRSISNTPLQALITLNNRVFQEASQNFSKELLSQFHSDTERLQWAYEKVTTKKLDPDSQAHLQQLLKELKAWFQDNPKEARTYSGLKATDNDVISAAAWTGLTRVLLNLDAFLTRE